MRTTKPIATISFNTFSFFDEKCKQLYNAKILSFYAFVQHFGEDDEGGKKDHIHAYFEPSKIVQTDDIRAEFREHDVLNPDKPPLCTLTFNTSKFQDWYLYSSHDKSYLQAKGQVRKFHYKYEDFACSDSDDMLYRVRSIDRLNTTPYQSMREAIGLGLSWADFFARGSIPIQQVLIYKKVWEMLVSEQYSNELKDRYEKLNNVTIDDTGEILQKNS